MGKLFENAYDSAVGEVKDFEGQMNDLGVKVERPNKKTAKAVSPWLKPFKTNSAKGIKGLSISQSYIGFSNESYEKLKRQMNDSGDVRIIIRVVEYEGAMTILIKADADGYKLNKYNKTGTWRVASKNVTDYINEAGVKIGRYRMEQLKDSSFLALYERGLPGQERVNDNVSTIKS